MDIIFIIIVVVGSFLAGNIVQEATDVKFVNSKDAVIEAQLVKEEKHLDVDRDRLMKLRLAVDANFSPYRRNDEVHRQLLDWDNSLR